MNLIWTVARELLGLFVDDGSLAIGILACVGLVAGLMRLALLAPAACGALLIVSLVALLLENLWRTARR